MDILSHGLWAGATYKTINKKARKKLNVGLASFWGVFPDILAFTIGFIWLLWNLAFSGLSFADLPNPNSVEPITQDTLFIFQLTSVLYKISHSAIIFFIIFFIAFLIFRRPIWELGGWFIHIIFDIPTHSYKFYPTPFLWPISGWKFNGFSWGAPWFLILNYSALIIVYLLLHNRKRLNQHNEN